MDEVANLVWVGRAWTILRSGQKGGRHIIPEGDLRASVQASVQLAEVIILREGKGVEEEESMRVLRPLRMEHPGELGGGRGLSPGK